MAKLKPLVKKAKNGKMRSSPEARRLIRAYVKRHGSQHKAARALHMTQAQLNGMLSGRLRDTPARKIAIVRADARARRAWLKSDHESQFCIDAPATLRAARRALEQAQSMIEMLLKENEK